MGGAISMMRNKPKGPKPERDPRLPEKPKGQTVGSFNGGLQVLPDGMAKRLSRYIRSAIHSPPSAVCLVHPVRAGAQVTCPSHAYRWPLCWILHAAGEPQGADRPAEHGLAPPL